jgi:hypothetical protein
MYRTIILGVVLYRSEIWSLMLRLSVEFEAVTIVTVMGSIFWGVMLCNPIEVHRSFRGLYSTHLQDRGVSLGSG